MCLSVVSAKKHSNKFKRKNIPEHQVIPDRKIWHLDSCRELHWAYSPHPVPQHWKNTEILSPTTFMYVLPLILFPHHFFDNFQKNCLIPLFVSLYSISSENMERISFSPLHIHSFYVYLIYFSISFNIQHGSHHGSSEACHQTPWTTASSPISHNSFSMPHQGWTIKQSKKDTIVKLFM